MAKIKNISYINIGDNWEFVCLPSNYVIPPDELDKGLEWLPCKVPTTVASSLIENNKWEPYQNNNLDNFDWCFRTNFEYFFSDFESKDKVLLLFEGLASIADVWLNNTHILSSSNMFIEHEIDITKLLKNRNDLYIRFYSLQDYLQIKRPRPRWRTKLVNDQQLRWVRTTLLGRIPSWTTSISPIGPWRSIKIEKRSIFTPEVFKLENKVIGNDGYISIYLKILCFEDIMNVDVKLIFSDNLFFSLKIEKSVDNPHIYIINDVICIPNINLWWPHTHGSQPLYDVRLILNLDNEEFVLNPGKLGFRRITWVLPDDHSNFKLSINGVDIFCRGACWTTLDIYKLAGDINTYRNVLTTVKEAGMNMLRISGTMHYELDDFFSICDELGILIWHDFMFANFDYPIEDDLFLRNIKQEVEQVVNNLQPHPCISLFCGNSEVEQQAAMLGLPPSAWSNSFFSNTIPEIVSSYFPEIPYWSSSPSGGDLPFLPNKGICHYQGVGAFLQPLEDARLAQIKFASECLTFANIPEDSTIEMFITSSEVSITNPIWKRRTPRDAGAGWDFEDIRDFYLKKFFNIDPFSLRYSNMEHYMKISKVLPGEVMLEVFSEWRRNGSSCQGALVWYLTDLWPGAGWGVFDSTKYPKAAFFYLKRILQPVCIFFIDEKLNGLYLQGVNETSIDMEALLQVTLYKFNGLKIDEKNTEITLHARSTKEFSLNGMFVLFRDLNYSYRFGPIGCDFIVANLLEKSTGRLISNSFYFPNGRPNIQISNLILEATATKNLDGTYSLTLFSDSFVQSIAIRTNKYFIPEDNYFHMEPGQKRTILLKNLRSDVKLSGTVQPLNTVHSVRIKLNNY